MNSHVIHFLRRAFSVPILKVSGPSGICLSKLFLAFMHPMPYNKQNTIRLPLSDGGPEQ